ncbi:MAG TPA: FkbM family methyltransferase [Streptosporangiaceae bacterium]|jgi:FkbM family methyltransferase
MTRRLSLATSVLRALAPRASFVEEEVAGLAEVVRPGAICFDIGAEYGLYTYPLSLLAGPAGLVHSFEPLPGAARVLSAGIGAFGCRNVRRFAGAVSDEPGAGELSMPRRNGLPVHGRTFLTTGANGLGPNTEFASADLVQTEITTIDRVYDHFHLPRVDFIKADVEGAEPKVVEGARRVIEAHHPTWLLEIEDRHLQKYGTSADALAETLKSSGYNMYWWTQSHWTPAAKVTDERRNYLFTTEAL